MPFDEKQFKQAMSYWATGITVVTTTHNGHYRGFTANSFSSVSINPLLVSVSVAKQLYTGQMIDKSDVYTVNILSNAQMEWGKLFAGMYPERVDRFAGIAHQIGKNDCPILPDVLAWFACRVHQKVDVGASVLMIGEVVDGGWSDTSKSPLLYYARQWGQFRAGS